METSIITKDKDVTQTTLASGSVGKILRTLREQKNMKQTDVGNCMGVSQPRVATIESQNETLEIDTVRRYLAALGMTISIEENAYTDQIVNDGEKIIGEVQGIVMCGTMNPGETKIVDVEYGCTYAAPPAVYIENPEKVTVYVVEHNAIKMRIAVYNESNEKKAVRLHWTAEASEEEI